MVNKRNAQGGYQSASGRVGFANLSLPLLFFFLEGRPHAIMWPTLCAGRPHTIMWPTLCTASHVPQIL